MSGLTISQFADEMVRIMPVLVKEFSRRHAGEVYKGKITLPQVLIMEFLDKEQEVKMKDIASFMGVSTAAITGIVGRLVKYGYAVRVFDPDDRRIIRIKLTPKGAELINRINTQRQQMIMRIFGRISEEDRQDYLRILQQIRDILLDDDIEK
jgi:DNA-binding MarR family transcriptional regulator